MHPAPAQWLLDCVTQIQLVFCNTLSDRLIAIDLTSVGNGLMHLLNCRFFLYELVLQMKGEISSNLYKLLLIQSSVLLLDNKGKISSLISALESSYLWICFCAWSIAFFPFVLVLILILQKTSLLGGAHRQHKIEGFLWFSLGVLLSNTRPIFKHKEHCQSIVWSF